MTTGISAPAVMALISGRPRVLALGEPTHGEDVLLEARNDLFRQLVSREGYRTIALESDCLRGLIVDDYVTSGAGTLDDVMERGFSHGFGAAPSNRALAEWMRAYNSVRAPESHVRFAGFDGPWETAYGESPRPALMALPGVSPDSVDALAGADDRWTNPAAMMDPSQSIGQTPEAQQLRLIADDAMAALDADPAASARDRLYARTAVGLLRYHRWMAEPSPARLDGVLRTRASMMAYNLLALAADGPVLAYAHNGHLQRPKSSMVMGGRAVQWWSAGAIVAAQVDYAFLATAIGTISHRGVGTPPPDTIEGLLYALPGDRYVVDPRQLGPAAPRVSPWFGYAPLDPAHLAEIDGLVFVKDAPEGPRWWPFG
jgi:erythromycin esterase-like protein